MMFPETNGVLSQQVDAAIAEYLNAVKRGAPPARDEFISQHKEIAAELEQFLTDHDALDGAARAIATRASTDNAANSTGRAAVLAQPSLTSPQRFGNFELMEEIARGGMGVVYKARQSTPSRIVALKMILAGRFATQADIDRFEVEAHAAAALDHPHIVPIFEVGECEGQHYFTMAFIEGHSLGQRLVAGPLPAKEAAEIIRDVSLAVEYAHQHGVIHRDLKPSNILLDPDRRVRITDFGLAKRQTKDSMLTHTGELLGTPSFMSPEQVSGGSKESGPATDVYSLGATLYALITGRPPFQAASTVDTLKQVVDQEPAPPRDLDATIPRDLETIVLKCLEKPVDRRYASAQALSDELNRFLEGRPITARPVGRTEHLWRWCRRNPVVASLTVAMLVALTTGVAASSYFAAYASREARVAKDSLREANLQRKNAEGINAFFTNEVFGLADPNNYERAGISLMDALDVAAEKIDKKFPDDPALRIALYEQLGEIYIKIGPAEKAVEHFEKTVKLWTELAGADDPRTLRCRSKLGRTLASAQRKESTEVLQATLVAQTRVMGPDHRDTLLTALRLAIRFMESGRANNQALAEFDAIYQRALRALGPRDSITLQSQNGVAWVMRGCGRGEEALKLSQAAARGLADVLGSDNTETMLATETYAMSLRDAGRYEEAATEFRALHEARSRLLSASHVTTMWATWQLAAVLSQLHQIPESKKLFDDLSSRLENPQNQNSHLMQVVASWLATARSADIRDGKRSAILATRACEITQYTKHEYVYTLAEACAEVGDIESASKWAQKAVELGPTFPQYHVFAALVQLGRGDEDGYRRICNTMRKEFATSNNPSSVFVLVSTCGLAQVSRDDQKVVMELSERLVASFPQNPDYLAALGILKYRAGEFEEAAKHLSTSLDIYKKNLPNELVAIEPRFVFAMTEWQLGHKDEARRHLSEAKADADDVMRSPDTWEKRTNLNVFRRQAEALVAPEVSSNTSVSRRISAQGFLPEADFSSFPKSLANFSRPRAHSSSDISLPILGEPVVHSLTTLRHSP